MFYCNYSYKLLQNQGFISFILDKIKLYAVHVFERPLYSPPDKDIGEHPTKVLFPPLKIERQHPTLLKQ